MAARFRIVKLPLNKSQDFWCNITSTDEIKAEMSGKNNKPHLVKRKHSISAQTTHANDDDVGLFYNHRCWGTLHSLGKPRTPLHTKVFWSWNSIMIPNTAATLHQNFWKIENKRLCNGPEKVPWLKKLDWNAVPELKWAVHKQMAAKKSGPKFLRSVLRDSQSQTEIRSFRFMLLNVGSTSYWIMGCT